MPMRRWWARGFARQLILVSAAGLAVRVGYVLLFRTDMTLTGNDAFVYHVGAELLADGYGFIEPLGAVGLLPPEESATHPPLFFLWLAAASLVDPGGASLTLHLLWSCVLGTATVVVCGLVGRVVAGRRCGVVAAAVAAIYPNVWVHDGMLLSETMALFTASLVLLTAYR
ncbi:MAG: hypothetical protein H0U26_05175, partial [Acidimicrobiia bacterium]|nr:hypothetical protein [Acidimicrobiia bacterium]